MSDLEFDYVVIGGGSAGAALAARLSEREDRTVALLEAGGDATHPFIHVPAAVAAAIGTPSLNWRFETVPQSGMAGRRIPVPRGKVVGGSGQINGMVYFRGHPTDFDNWADMGAKGWSYREVLPYFTRTENNEDFPQSVFHGKGGPINVKYVRNPNRMNHDYMAALATLQFPACADFNGPDPEGYGFRQGLLRDGRRESTARSMLLPASRSRRNLTVLTQAQVARIIFEGRRASGVVLTDGRAVKARAEVALCAGAVQSPQILLASGVGPAAHLNELGIDIVHDLPGVGGNYHDHVACPVHMETQDPTSYGISWKALPRGAWNVLQYLFGRTGPLAGNVFESVAFLRTDPSLAKPDVQFVFQPAKRLTTKLPLPMGHGYAISPVALYPKSRGTLRLATPDVRDAPLIDPRLLAEEDDILPLLRAVKIARQAFAAPAFAKYRGVEVAPGPDVQSDEDIKAFIRAAGYTVHHPCGTCRMGVDAEAVVDPDLRVHGIEGLRVADASVFPLLIGGNTNAPAVMVGERGADKILGKPDLPPADLPPESVGRKA
ncbi:putative oxidoreductase [Sphingobium sp. SYK-6]|uniref:GMC family oxidoreductase n=1 Tax=Sphingobium sp. (strain NBRC 103272 / SYK-6) TaxID=627192 RepID=UPI00022775EA|nr:GMC family oxidoreductase N-terminal domain-containing protein [Sphingobium sp. SYK-6]BAK66692.1 putative oxidoreductase [Sphingobium sp. SYK-6]